VAPLAIRRTSPPRNHGATAPTMSAKPEDVLDALRAVQDPDLHRDLVSLGMIQDVEVRDGAVSLTLELTTAACPLRGQIEDDVRRAVLAVPGVRDLALNTTSRVRKAKDPSADRHQLPGVAHVIAVGAGKGGVGKSTVAANLALALAASGARVGLLDADMYGPNLPRMLGAQRQPSQRDGKLVPLEVHGVAFMSMGLLASQGEAVVWRGPMLNKMLVAFLDQVDWGTLDYLIVDLPPGTGDVPLSLTQNVYVDGAVVVSTSSAVALEDAVKAVDLFRKLQVPVLGMIENMSVFVCPDCGARHAIFDSGRTEEQALALGVPFLGAVPLHPAVRRGGDEGRPVVVSEPASPYATALREIAGRLAQRVSIATMKGA
jgi:ATP-binding protein involved in chromosome partitioning